MELFQIRIRSIDDGHRRLAGRARHERFQAMLNEPSIVDREVEAALRGDAHDDDDGTGEARFERADERERLKVPAGGR